MSRTVRTGEIRDKSTETGSCERTGRLERKSRDRTTSAGQPFRKDRAGRLKKTGQHSWGKTIYSGPPWSDKQQDSQNRTDRTEQLGQDNQGRTMVAEQLRQDGTSRREQQGEVSLDRLTW
jgi:hypothetical protein